MGDGTIWGPHLPNVTRHSGWWTHTVTPSIDRTLHQFLTITDLDLITEFDFFTLLYKVSIEHMQQVRHANRGRLLLRTPDPVPFWTCMCSNVETNLSWTCLVSGLYNFEHPSVLLFCLVRKRSCETNENGHGISIEIVYSFKRKIRNEIKKMYLLSKCLDRHIT